MKKVLVIALLLMVSLTVVVEAQNPADYVFRPVVSGLTRPLQVTYAPDDPGRLFVVEQDGRIRIIQNGSVLSTAFLDIASLVSRNGPERGLLGLAFHPNYTQNGWFFVNYTNTQGNTVVARYTVSSDPNRANASSAAIVLTQTQPYANHNGGHLAFGPDGYLYIGLGDGGSGGDPENRAQNRQTWLGKMLRINVNQLPYTVPANNPFVNTTGTLPEIWALGLRNPWRYSFDRATGDLYIADVGQNQWEEVNFQAANNPGGQNYGWRVYEGTHPFNGGPLAGAVMPVAEYSHSGGNCSVTGGYVYRGAALPGLQGYYFYGDLCSGVIWTLRNTGGNWVASQFRDTNYSITSFGEDQQGELYLVDYNGSILRFESATPPTPSRTPTQTATFTPTAIPTNTPTSVPTIVPTNTREPSATTVPSETPTETPTNTPEPSATPVPSETATEIPTNTLEPTASETPTSTPTVPMPTGPALRVDVSPASANVGDSVSVALNLFNVTGLFGLQANCMVDPAVLAGVSRSDGDGFNADNSFFVDSTYQADGHWLVAATRLDPNPAINGNATAFTLVYTVQNAGGSPVTCSVVGVDENGHDLPLEVINGSFNGAIAVTETPTSEPITPTVEIAPSETPTPEPTATSVPAMSTISGIASYQNRPDNAGITVRLVGADGAAIAEQVTSANGSYSFGGVAVGTYTVQLSAALHLSVMHSVSVESDGQAVDAGSDMLYAGDTDGNALIDVLDATFVGANFDVTMPPAPPEADINGDGLVNISDLVLVGSNFGLSGPIVVE
jgi:glucose/arabinose dehydrogenase